MFNSFMREAPNSESLPEDAPEFARIKSFYPVFFQVFPILQIVLSELFKGFDLLRIYPSRNKTSLRYLKLDI